MGHQKTLSFDSVDHGWLLRMIAHRIADRRVLRLIERWLNPRERPMGTGGSGDTAGVGDQPDSGECLPSLYRRPLGSPVATAAGQIIVCRYADDLVLGCQHEADGKKLLVALKDRLRSVTPRGQDPADRVRAVRRPTAASRRAATPGDFLGFTHYCGETRSGRFMVKRKTQAKRMVRKLKILREEMARRMHTPIREQHQWLCQVLRGHCQYYGVIFNYRALRAFKDCVVRLWRKTLSKRSQKGRMTWESFKKILTAFPLPEPVIHQAWHR
jgi:hypothetical protein